MLTDIIDLFIFVLKLMSTRLACGHPVPPSEHHFEISVPEQSSHFFLLSLRFSMGFTVHWSWLATLSCLLCMGKLLLFLLYICNFDFHTPVMYFSTFLHLLRKSVSVFETTEGK